MGLEKYLSSAVSRIKASFSSDRKKWADYLEKYELKDYFSPDLSDEQRDELRGKLEKIVQAKTKDYDKILGNTLRKVSTSTTMGVEIANDIYSFVSNTVPLYNSMALRGLLFGLKSVAEIPDLYRYIKKSGDWYGALKFIALKPVNYLIPILGEALEAGAFDRMVRKGIMKEAKYEFIKENGEYAKPALVVKSRLKKPLRDAVELPEMAPAPA